MKVFCKDFLFLQFGFVIFCQKNVIAKAACKMLANIFTNILQADVLTVDLH